MRVPAIRCKAFMTQCLDGSKQTLTNKFRLCRRLHFPVFGQGSDFLKAPNVVRKPRFHRRGNAQGLVNPPIVVEHEVKGYGVAWVLDGFSLYHTATDTAAGSSPTRRRAASQP